MNCSNDRKKIENSRPSASNFKSFSQSLEQFFLTVGQNNFGNKIPLLTLLACIRHWPLRWFAAIFLRPAQPKDQSFVIPFEHGLIFGPLLQSFAA